MLCGWGLKGQLLEETTQARARSTTVQEPWEEPTKSARNKGQRQWEQAGRSPNKLPTRQSRLRRKSSSTNCPSTKPTTPGRETNAGTCHQHPRDGIMPRDEVFILHPVTLQDLQGSANASCPALPPISAGCPAPQTAKEVGPFREEGQRGRLPLLPRQAAPPWSSSYKRALNPCNPLDTNYSNLSTLDPELQQAHKELHLPRQFTLLHALKQAKAEDLKQKQKQTIKKHQTTAPKTWCLQQQYQEELKTSTKGWFTFRLSF